MNLIESAIREHHENATFRALNGNRRLLDFSSNDYLGLSNCSVIRSKLATEITLGCPLGSTGSRLLSGNTIYHERVECFLQSTFDVDSALLFGSGFLANLGVLSALASLDAEFFSDELNHASLIDGMRTTKLKQVFKHNDIDHLEKLLSTSKVSTKVIVTETVFSMDGDLAPISDLIKLAEKFDAWIIFDEAHATGVFGRFGLGRLQEYGSSYGKIISVHTGGKALGGHGAFVLSCRVFRYFLINRARTFIFSTALAPLSCLQIEFALLQILQAPDLGLSLLEACTDFRKAISKHLNVGRSQSPIVPIILGSNQKALELAKRLQELGFDVRAIRAPSVPVGMERLRVTLKAFHSEDDLKALSKALIQEVIP